MRPSRAKRFAYNTRESTSTMLPSSASSASVPVSPELSARWRVSALFAVTSQLRICPPSRATSIRTNESSANGNHRGQNAVHGVGMDECDLEPVKPAPRSFVDELRAYLGELAHRGLHVVGLESHVVHARPAPREEAADGRVVAGRLEELDAALADEQRGGLDPLLGQRVSVLDPRGATPLRRP